MPTQQNLKSLLLACDDVVRGELADIEDYPADRSRRLEGRKSRSRRRDQQKEQICALVESVRGHDLNGRLTWTEWEQRLDALERAVELLLAWETAWHAGYAGLASGPGPVPPPVAPDGEKGEEILQPTAEEIARLWQGQCDGSRWDVIQPRLKHAVAAVEAVRRCYAAMTQAVVEADGAQIDGNPFSDLIQAALSADDDATMEAGKCRDQPAPRDQQAHLRARGANARLLEVVAAARRAADRLGVPLIEAERRLVPLADAAKTAIFWQFEADSQLKQSPGGGYANEAALYLKSNYQRLCRALPEVQALADRWPPQPKLAAALELLGSVATSGADTEVSQGRLSELASSTSPSVRKKKSTQRGDANEKLRAGLLQHHRYRDGSCLNPEPVGNNQLARSVSVDPASATAFFRRHFKGYKRYRVLCRDQAHLVVALQVLSGEFFPHHLLGSDLDRHAGEPND